MSQIAPSPWNQSQLFSSASVEWGTPEWLFDRLDWEFVFQLDACAGEHNAKVDHWISPADDALEVEWGSCLDRQEPNAAVWMNPPWGRGIGRFVERAYRQSKEHRLVVVCLLPASTDTRWWHDYVMLASEVRFVRGRLHFVRDDGHTGPCTKGCAVVVFTPWSNGPPAFSSLER